MYPVTHVAIAVGSVWASKHIRIRTVAPASPPSIDYRLVALGGLVPDLIDKPLSWVLFPGTFPDSHIYGHTLLLPLVLIIAGLITARSGDLRLLALGFGCLTHPLVDPVILYPRTLFWPLLGTDFPEPEIHLALYQRIAEATLIMTGVILYLANSGFREAARRLVLTGRLAWQRSATRTASRRRT